MLSRWLSRPAAAYEVCRSAMITSTLAACNAKLRIDILSWCHGPKVFPRKGF